MDLLKTNQVTPESLSLVKFDLIIAASSREERCSYLLNNFSFQTEARLALSYKKSHLERFKTKNTDFFKERDFEILEMKTDNAQPVLDKLSEILEAKSGKKINILIDYSSMVKTWYAGIIHYLTHLENYSGEVNVYFSYTPSLYSVPKKSGSVKQCTSLLPGNGMKNPEKPTAMIIGLGIEPGGSRYLIKNHKADSVILFYSDPAPAGYVEAVFSNNREVIDHVEIRSMYNYPLDDVQQINTLLTSTCLDLRLKYNLVIVPIGPKIFTLTSLLLATRFPDIEVLRVSTSANSAINKKEAAGTPVICHTCFVNSFEY